MAKGDVLKWTDVRVIPCDTIQIEGKDVLYIPSEQDFLWLVKKVGAEKAPIVFTMTENFYLFTPDEVFIYSKRKSLKGDAR
jgi:hypothetical protein